MTKLRGVELHHFAAFYKSSWRAWDWMWGRLDGSGWLVHILLDPARILAVVENQGIEPRAGGRHGSPISSGIPSACAPASLVTVSPRT